jgi:diguanylate cyclase (GGDEF)-like protein/PAS domain S-box-containing protein
VSLDNRKLAQLLMLVVVTAGMAITASSLRNLPFELLGFPFCLIVILSIGVGLGASLKVPGFSPRVSIADSLTFLALLTVGGEMAILISVLEALVSSLRISRKRLTVAFNGAAAAVSTYASLQSVRLAFGSELRLTEHGTAGALVVAACLIAVIQYAANSSIVGLVDALRSKRRLWPTLKLHYSWTLPGYFAGAFVAVAIARLGIVVGPEIYAALLPLMGVVHLTYSAHLKNKLSGFAQTEQAERHLLELRQSEERFRSAFDHAPIGMAMVTTDGKWVEVNRSLCEITGYPESEMLATDYQSITHPEDLQRFENSIRQLVSGEITAFQLEKRYINKRGESVWILAGVSMIKDRKNTSPHLIFQIQDVNDRKKAETQMLHDAFHDALTGLHNRAWFMERVELSIKRSRRAGGEPFAVLFLDLDRFKVINDSLGHICGDQLLIGIATRLNSCVRPEDLVARLGGDEFTILLKGVSETADAVRVAERIQRLVAQPFKLGGYDAFTTTSIGIALADGNYEHPDDLLRDADTAMYHAKASGKARYAIFDKSMHAHAMNVLQLETDLRRAIERQEFELHYQPIVDLKTGRLTSFEALIRWRHPERGLIGPGDFMSVAEETGLIVTIGEWVLREACSQANLWRAIVRDTGPLSISVNLSSKQLGYVHLADQIIRTLDATGLAPCALKLEITESAVMENVESAARMLQQLRALGVELAIDDFGTGYSSLSYLHRLPIDTLKIDRSFISSVGGNNENREIVRTILTLAKTLGKGVVAEGIETMEQLEFLRQLGCDSAQGFLFSKPVPANIVFQLIERMSGWHEGTIAGEPSNQGTSFPSLVSMYQM